MGNGTFSLVTVSGSVGAGDPSPPSPTPQSVIVGLPPVTERHRASDHVLLFIA